MEPSTEEKPDSYFDIVVVGACFCDLLTYIPCYPKPGEMVRGDKFLFDFGGKGANMCVIAAKLGGKNAMVSMVGDDAFGRETIRNFKKFGVNTDWISISHDAATGITNSSLKNSVFHVPARHVNVVDTTGAGDALTGALAYFMTCYPHLTFKEMVTRAVAIATQTVEMKGVQKSYPDRDCFPQELFS